MKKHSFNFNLKILPVFNIKRIIVHILQQMETSSLINKLSANLLVIIDLANGIPEKEQNIKADGKWSILEIFEHLLLTERSVHRLLLKKAEKQHSSQTMLGSAKIKRMLLDRRSVKITAPPYLVPTGIFTHIDAFTSAFLAERNGLIDDLKTGRILVDNSIFNHPVLGELTITDWIDFVIAHTERHMLQIQEMRETQHAI